MPATAFDCAARSRKGEADQPRTQRLRFPHQRFKNRVWLESAMSENRRRQKKRGGGGDGYRFSVQPAGKKDCYFSGAPTRCRNRRRAATRLRTRQDSMGAAIDSPRSADSTSNGQRTKPDMRSPPSSVMSVTGGRRGHVQSSYCFCGVFRRHVIPFNSPEPSVCNCAPAVYNHKRKTG